MLGFPTDVITFNVGGRTFQTLRNTFPSDTPFYKWFVTGTKEVPFTVKDNAFFIDRDPDSFAIILNYFRLKRSEQLWEACLPKDPDRLALLTQEADYFSLYQLRDQAVNVLQSCSEKESPNYLADVLSRSISCPQGLKKILDD